MRPKVNTNAWVDAYLSSIFDRTLPFLTWCLWDV